MTSSPIPSSSSRSRAELLKLATWPVFALFLSLAVYLWLHPTGLRELRRSQRAVRAAKSWHSIMATKLPDGTSMISGFRDVVCPADFDQTTIHHEENGRTDRQVMLNGTFYTQLPMGGWQHGSNTFMPIFDCSLGPYLGSSFLYSDLDEIERNGEIHRGGAQSLEGAKCRWWHVLPQKGSPPRYSVCLNADDHLPRLVNSVPAGISVSFSRWNSTTIAPPVSSDP